MQSSQVVRNQPRDRGKYGDISGVLSIALKTLSKRDGDGLDSYLHVGSGVERLEVKPNLAAFTREIKVKGLYEVAKTRWHEIVGTGGLMEMSMVGGKIVIPGSSVKGNVRSRMELSFVSKDGRVRSCFSVDRPKGMKWKSSFSRVHQSIWFGKPEAKSAAMRGPSCDVGKWKEVCLICDLFGARGLASLVYFSDLIGEDVKAEPVTGEFGLNLMAAPPGSTFKGEISFRNLRESELGLILLTGLAVNADGIGRPVLFGRLKYRHTFAGRRFGRVRYSVEALKLSKFSRHLQDLKPGEEARGDELKAVIRHLLDSAKGEFGNEVQTVEEVRDPELA